MTGEPAPTSSPSPLIPPARIELNALLRELGWYRIEYQHDRPAMVYDQFGHVGYVDDEGFVVPVLIQEPSGRMACPTCGKPR